MRSHILLAALVIGCPPVLATSPLATQQSPDSDDQERVPPQRTPSGEKAEGENDGRGAEGARTDPTKDDPGTAQARKSRDAMLRYLVGSSIASRGLGSLIESPVVRAELGIGKRQFDELLRIIFERRIAEGEAARAYTARARAGATNLGMPSFKEFIAGFHAETDQFLLASLNPKQRRRLRQISLQAQGPLAAFFDPDVAQKMRLQPKQIEKLRALLGDRVDDDDSALRDPKTGRPPTSPEEVDSAILDRQEGRLSTRDAALDLLSERQRQVYDAAYGEPFDLTKIPPGPSSHGPSAGEAPSTDGDPR